MAEQYSKMVECATELADFFLDQEGGAFALAVVCEILQVLLGAGQFSAACLAIKIIFHSTKVELPTTIAKCKNDIHFYYMEQLVELLSEILKTRLWI